MLIKFLGQTVTETVKPTGCQKCGARRKNVVTLKEQSTYHLLNGTPITVNLNETINVSDLDANYLLSITYNVHGAPRHVFEKVS